MKTVFTDNDYRLLRFDKDEELISALAKYAKDENLPGGNFSAIGSCSMIELGYYNPFLKDYRRKPFLDNLEILSLNGNVSWSGGEPAVHAHGVFGGNDFQVMGGHVFKLVVMATCEVAMVRYQSQVKRVPNPDFNLSLLE